MMEEISKDTFATQPACHWKCFNCHKEFDLSRKAGH
jgi:hypothetical protein